MRRPVRTLGTAWPRARSSTPTVRSSHHERLDLGRFRDQTLDEIVEYVISGKADDGLAKAITKVGQTISKGKE